MYKRRGRFSFDFATTTEFVSPEAAARSLERGESPEAGVQILAWEFIYGPLPTPAVGVLFRGRGGVAHIDRRI
ncbi:MAG: hypothetical protein F4Z17_04875 [Acidimicrobiia bacterium]|nr:hypothetical protein [Acidimicrobiia bacterium]